jgi:hypothetical protein
MRESRTYGSVRGAGSNLRPYRDRLARCTKVVSYLGYTGRPADVVAKTALDASTDGYALQPAQLATHLDVAV